MTMNFREIAAVTGSPAYVFSEEIFRKRAEQVKETFGDRTQICFSMKANPFLLGIMPEVFSKVEVCSPGELTICERLGVDMDSVIFSGVNKSPKDVARAMDDGAGVLTIESRSHLLAVNACALERNRRVRVLIRLTGGSQFGMDETEILDIFRHCEVYRGIDIAGIHYFTGTQKRKPAAVIKELDFLSSWIDHVKKETGFDIREVEYGTGLAVDYFKEDADRLEQERLEAIAPAVRSLSEKVHLTVEMGRFFAASCGFYLTAVADTKTNCGIHYIICDGGLHQLKYDGQIQGMQLPVITHVQKHERQNTGRDKWTLCGSLCTTADVLARDVELDGPEPGDILVFHRTGAYSVMEGMSVFLSRDMPAVYILAEDGTLRRVRRRIETAIVNTPEISG